LANLFAKPNCRIVKLHSFCRIEMPFKMPNRIARSSNWSCFAESKYPIELLNRNV
jgi:hypothetical protein